jgi:hypothetical protein
VIANKFRDLPVITSLVCLLAVGTHAAQMRPSRVISPARQSVGEPGLVSNQASILTFSGDTVWLAAETSVSRLDGVGTSQFHWTSYEVPADLVRPGHTITAFAAQGEKLAVSLSYTFYSEQNQPFGAGNGLYLSTDGGLSWDHHPMTEIFIDREGMRAPGGETQCFGIWFDGDDLWSTWTSEFAAMTPDWGQSWQRFRPDSTNNPQPNPFLDDTTRLHRYFHLNYRGYDGTMAGDTLWISTNAGVNRSIDGGKTWTTYDALGDGLTGDFVPAIRANPYDGVVWAATQSTGIDENDLKNQSADYFDDDVIDSLDYDLDRDNKLDGQGVHGISWTTDGGDSWQSFVPEEDPELLRTFRAWNFAFDGSTVWIAGTYSSGDVLFRSDDIGQTWQVQSIITADGAVLATEDGTGDVVFANGVLWAATGKGLARSTDRGTTWQLVLRYPQTNPLDGGPTEHPAGAKSGFETYAFPSPSAPARGDHPVIAFALSQPTDVTIEIYDAGGALVRTLRRTNVGTGNQTIIWDGLDERGGDHFASNGVYIYRIRTTGGHSATGKLVVLN